MRRGFRRSDARRGSGGRAPQSEQPEGPFSRAQVLHLMRTEIARARRHGFAVACMLMQVDDLPADLLRLAGDELLGALRRELGALVRDKTRGHDHVGLVDERRYLLVLPHTGPSQALLVAERVVGAFAELDVAGLPDAIDFTPSLSIGVSHVDDPEMLFFETVLGRAEAALETARAAGGGRCELYGSATLGAPGPDAAAPEATEHGPSALDPDPPDTPPAT